MKEIVVVSGKGGTGKTSLTAAFADAGAVSLLADCDVDAADLTCAVVAKIQTSHDFYGGREAIIDWEKCTACLQCVNACRFDALEQIGAVVSVRPFRCEGCGVCAVVCPENAVGFEKARNGEWYHSKTDYGDMIHARLTPGSENSGKLVTRVREEAKKNADESSLLLIDGPPGIGCAVIAAMTGTNAAVIVTEPTLSGIHDMKRICALARRLKVPPLLVINKYDLNPDVSSRIEKFSRENDIVCMGQIPYAQEITAAQRRNTSVVRSEPAAEISRHIQTLWKDILNEL
jgi:MinD superfamily P-loop ATPase